MQKCKKAKTGLSENLLENSKPCSKTFDTPRSKFSETHNFFAKKQLLLL